VAHGTSAGIRFDKHTLLVDPQIADAAVATLGNLDMAVVSSSRVSKMTAVGEVCCLALLRCQQQASPWAFAGGSGPIAPSA
jgi:hypothetical protein